MLFGAFFIVSVFACCLLDSLIRFQYQKIQTFEQLATINSPIFIRDSLDVDGICETLEMKMDKDVICKDDKMFYITGLSFVYIAEANIADVVMGVLKDNYKDFDILQESFGNV